MMQTKLPINDILGMSEINRQAKALLQNHNTRKRNWRVLSLWRELRKNKIAYYFLSKDQIALPPIPLVRPAIIIGIEKISVPGAGFSIDYYSVTNIQSGVKLSLNCTSGASLLQKLVRFSIIMPSEIPTDQTVKNYEPYQHCPACGARNKMYAIVCEMCGSKIK